MRIAGKSAADIFESIRALVQNGQLPPGAALPTVRDLALQLTVNRNTVAAAYQRLVTAGIAVTRGRHGTFIRERQAPGEQEGSPFDSPLTDVASGNPAPDLLPDPLQYLNREAYSTRLYGEAVINPELEALAIDWFREDCANPYEVNITHGAVDAIERLLITHLVTGDKVAIEDPCFLGSINTLRLKGFQILPVAVDERGMRPEALAQALAEGARAVICTPRAHNPTGCSVDAARAKVLKKLLAQHPNLLIIEDDHFALLANTPCHSLVSPTNRCWAMVRSVSKCYGPDLRIAFVASDPETSQRLRMRLASGTTWVSHILQNIVFNLLRSKDVKKIVAAARNSYTEKRTRLIHALEKKGIAVQSQADGLNVWVSLTASTASVTERMAQCGWLVRNGEGFYVSNSQPALRLTIATLSLSQIENLADDLLQCLD
ncbi:MocR-like B6 salvage transcription factor PtsJ [Cellvibrio polysaccharolyticus]|uniref:Transcriptional regulator PtsJ n=1 Tax=Cellvibrio polysaccharolyticus TaxID=2082724 RepID=A0A928V8Q1_9GAMM|nr:transcriptional regulator PtsJ [Cellvibrio polysaccharolyticus]MBE8718099.1 transcriptional regulator PtsJ [Cellvibrio polysaccharolyticus]